MEGAATEGGRKPSIWDTFCQVPGRIDDASSGEIACDHYHRYEADVKLMAELGAKHYRFSLAWPRILQDGRRAVNEKGLDFYKRLIDCLGAHGITPHATLYHWDCPQTLEDEYRSWQSRRIADDFAEYAAVVGKRLGDRVQNWMTLNEIGTFTLFCGYGVGHRGEHIAAANKAFRCDNANDGILVPLLTGKYDPVWWSCRARKPPTFATATWRRSGSPSMRSGSIATRATTCARPTINSVSKSCQFPQNIRRCTCRGCISCRRRSIGFCGKAPS